MEECDHVWIEEITPGTGIEKMCLYCGEVRLTESTACNCKECTEKAKKQERFLNHPFYKEVKQFSEEIERQQILKGAEKYKEPFTPDSWTVDELAAHAMQENRDQAVYITGMRDRMRKQEKEIEFLRNEIKSMENEAEYWRLRAVNECAKPKR